MNEGLRETRHGIGTVDSKARYQLTNDAKPIIFYSITPQEGLTRVTNIKLGFPLHNIEDVHIRSIFVQVQAAITNPILGIQFHRGVDTLTIQDVNNNPNLQDVVWFKAVDTGNVHPVSFLPIWEIDLSNEIMLIARYRTPKSFAYIEIAVVDPIGNNFKWENMMINFQSNVMNWQ